MNKRSNPFYPPSAGTAHPPYVPTTQQQQPPAGSAPGYSSYWAQNGQYQQPPQSQWPVVQPSSQSSAPPPAPRASAEHASLYANYGYGGSHSLAWNNQAHNQAQSAAPSAAAPLPISNQHQAIPIPYAASYPPSQPHHPGAPQHQPHQPHQPQHQYAPSTPQYHPAQPGPVHHYNLQPPPVHQQPPPQHMPPAKRPRYDQPPPPPQHQPPRYNGPPPPQHRGPMHGGPPPGPMGPPPPQVSANMTPLGGVSGRMGPGPSPGPGPGNSFANPGFGGRGGGPRPPPMRGGGMGMGPPMNRSPMRGRGPAPMINGRPMSGPPNHMRGGGRMQAGMQRRPMQRGPAGAQNYQRNASGMSSAAKGGQSHGNAASKGSTSVPSPSAAAKRDDSRRTFTDFKIVGLELRNTDWRWGQTRDASGEPQPAAPSVVGPGTDGKSADPASEPVTSPAVSAQQPVAAESGAAPSAAPQLQPAASRIRIYFHNPKLDGVNGSVNGSVRLGGTPPPRASKRKKGGDDDDADSVELEGEQRARRPRPPHAPPEDGASVTGTEDEDWLMAAMVEQSASGDAAGEAAASTHGAAGVPGADAQSDGSQGQAASEWSEVVVDGRSLQDTSAVASPAPTTGALNGGHVVSEDDDAAGAKTPEAPDAADDAVIAATADTNDAAETAEPDPYKELMSPDSSVVAVDPSIVDESADPLHEDEPMDEPVEPGIPQLADESSLGWNRVSIAYDGGLHRLIVASAVVQKLTVFRAEGRIEIELTVTPQDEHQLDGIVLESLLDRATQEHAPLSVSTEAAEADALVPPLMSIASTTQQVTLIAYLDLHKPLSSAKWVKTNDLQEWLRTTAGKQAAFKTPDSWIGRVFVSDPDPPPNIYTVLDAWTHASNIGALPDRKTFVADHLMNNISNILEILLRMMRSDRVPAFVPQAVSQASVDQLGAANPLADAMTLSSPLAKHQTHVSLTVLAMYKMLDEQAKAAGPAAIATLTAQVSELVRCLPQNQVYKSLDMMFKDVSNYKPKVQKFNKA